MKVAEHHYTENNLEWILYDADDECNHDCEQEESEDYNGVRCVKCGGWFCY